MTETGRQSTGHEGGGIQPRVLDLARIMVIDASGKISLWTTGMERLYGYSSAEARGCCPRELLRTRSLTPESEISGRLLKDSEWSGEITNYARGGTSLIVWCHRVAQHGPSGEVREITELHQPVMGEARVRGDQTMLAEIVESTADAIIGKTLDGIVTSWNQAATNIFGYSAEEMIGRPIEILAAPGRESEMPAILEALRRGERVRHLDTERRHKSGGIIHAAITVSPIRDETGVPIGASEIARDITAVRQARIDLEEREARLRAIFQSMPDGMILIDHEGIIQSYSPTAERIFGWVAEEVRGKNIRLLMPSLSWEPRNFDFDRDTSHGLASIIGIDQVAAGLRRNGETFPLELSVGEVKTGGPSSFTVFVRDISERQETELRLREAQSELIHVSRLSAMGQMAAMLAHELNQPLTAIANYMRAGRMLLEAQETPPIGKLREAIDRAGTEALRAGQIIRRLREFISRKETRKQAASIAEVIEEANTLALIGLRRHATKIVAPADQPPAMALIDRVQIQQVLLNLIRNAVEATSDLQTQVAITMEARDDTIVVSVIDEGTGLADELAGRLFEPFLSTKSSGMGIGLSICRSIIEAHGGRLWHEPNPKGGAVFRFSLATVPDGRARDG